jgi:bifunctional DNA-binding transcriptional regulator/antitoxin component of YhaV-PrlF toxin-antitoxin module
MTQLAVTVQFQSRGILNIPKTIRQFFQIDKGTLAKIFVKNDAIIIKPVEVISSSQFKPRIFSKKEIARWLKEDTLDKKTLAKLDEKLKSSGGLNNPVIKKWLKR